MITLYKKVPKDSILERITTNYANHELVRFHDVTSDGSEIAHAIQGQSLFGGDRIIFLSSIDRELWDVVIDALHHVPTTTIVFWLEDAFPVAYLKKMPDHTMIEGEKEKEITAANPFGITNLIGTGDGVALWAMYQQLLQDGHEPEALFGIIWWKLKDLAKKKQSISPAFKKTLHTFMNTYSNARSSGGDLESGLEQILLSMNKNLLG
jgi:DNA polymerase III delta subunit